MNVVDIDADAPAPISPSFLNDVERLEAIFATWEETPRGAVEAYRRAIEAAAWRGADAAGAGAESRIPRRLPR